MLYCSVDPEHYDPEHQPLRWTIGYLGAYSEDRQPGLDRLLTQPARRLTEESFAVAGPLYPADMEWPQNVRRIEHLPPGEHRAFYNSQKYTLNITRADMIEAGYSPSVRLFEAAACGTPIISDYWTGLDEIFEIGREILVARTTDDVLRLVRDIGDAQRQEIGRSARAKVLAMHTARFRALQVEQYALEVLEGTAETPPRKAKALVAGLERASQPR